MPPHILGFLVLGAMATAILVPFLADHYHARYEALDKAVAKFARVKTLLETSEIAIPVTELQELPVPENKVAEPIVLQLKPKLVAEQLPEMYDEYEVPQKRAAHG